MLFGLNSLMEDPIMSLHVCACVIKSLKLTDDYTTKIIRKISYYWNTHSTGVSEKMKVMIASSKYSNWWNSSLDWMSDLSEPALEVAIFCIENAIGYIEYCMMVTMKGNTMIELVNYASD